MMPTRPQTLGVLIGLAALAAGLEVGAAHAQPPEIRIVTVRAVAEEQYRAQPGWEAMLRRTVQTVSEIYERTFQIRFVVRDVVPWSIGARGVPIGRILARVRTEVTTGPADVLVLFAAERCEKLEYGFALTFGRYAMVQTGCLDTAVLTRTAPEVVLSHEVAHLFGAFHPAAGRSDTVMVGGPADRFDGQTVRVIRLMRDYDFTRGILGVDAETRRAWSAIYAEGHARGDRNPLLGALLNAAADMLGEGRPAEAEALIRDVGAMDPTYARPRALLGVLLARQGRLEDAARELEAAKRLSFREVDARTELGFVLLRLGREEEALVELRDVLRVDRHATRAYVGIGAILARRDRLPEAITAYQSAVQVDARHGPAHLGLAEVFDRVGRPGEAWGAAEQAHDLGEDVPAPLWQRLAEKHPPAPPLPPMCPDPGGPAVDLDTPDPVYRSYFARVGERVRAHVRYPRIAREQRVQGETRIEIRFAPTGRVECVAVRRSSGSELLDRYLLSAVRLAQPFPPPPPQLATPLSVTGTFRFRTRGPEPEASR